MAIISIKLLPETVRTLAFGAIGAAYMGIGTAISNPSRMMVLQNLTDTLLMFSFDGVNDHIPLPGNGQIVLDITANRTVQGGSFFIAEGTRFYVRQIVAPTAGAVYLSTFYGAGL